MIEDPEERMRKMDAEMGRNRKSDSKIRLVQVGSSLGMCDQDRDYLHLSRGREVYQQTLANA